MNLTVHYSIIMGLYWANYAVLLNYASVYLLGHGFQNTEIGILIALSALLSAVIQPLIGSYADKPNSPSVKLLLVFIVCLFLTGNALIPPFAAYSDILLFIIYALTTMLMQIMMPLTNSLGTMTARTGKSINFGIARGIGSLSYAVTSVLAGSLITEYGIGLIPYMSLGLYAVFAFCVYLFPFQKQTVSAGQAMKASFLKKYPSFTIVLLASAFLYSSHTMINNFMFQIISSKGGDSESLGVAFAIAAMAELPIMFAFSRLLCLLPAGKWMLISGFAFLAKSTGTLLVTSVMGFYGVQLIQILAYAVLTVASVYYTDGIMEPQDAVKGQTFFATTVTIGSVFGSAAGGRLIDSIGINALLIVSIAFAAIGSIIMYFGMREPRREHL